MLCIIDATLFFICFASWHISVTCLLCRKTDKGFLRDHASKEFVDLFFIYKVSNTYGVNPPISVWKTENTVVALSKIVLRKI